MSSSLTPVTQQLLVLPAAVRNRNLSRSIINWTVSICYIGRLVRQRCIWNIRYSLLKYVDDLTDQFLIHCQFLIKSKQDWLKFVMSSAVKPQFNSNYKSLNYHSVHVGLMAAHTSRIEQAISNIPKNRIQRHHWDIWYCFLPLLTRLLNCLSFTLRLFCKHAYFVFPPRCTAKIDISILLLHST